MKAGQVLSPVAYQPMALNSALEQGSPLKAQKAPGKPGIQTAVGDSFASQKTVSGFARHLIKAKKSAFCHANL
jgi:hypothetical protein